MMSAAAVMSHPSFTCFSTVHLYHTVTHTHTTVLRPTWILSRTTRVSRHQKGKTNLDLLEQEIVSGNGIIWAICKICTLTQTHNHAGIPPLRFLRVGCPSCAQPTASKHWRQIKALNALIA